MELYTIKQLAEKLNVSVATIRNYINNGIIEASKFGRKIYITEDQLKRALENKKLEK